MHGRQSTTKATITITNTLSSRLLMGTHIWASISFSPVTSLRCTEFSTRHSHATVCSSPAQPWACSKKQGSVSSFHYRRLTRHPSYNLFTIPILSSTTTSFVHHQLTYLHPSKYHRFPPPRSFHLNLNHNFYHLCWLHSLPPIVPLTSLFSPPINYPRTLRITVAPPPPSLNLFSEFPSYHQ